MKGLPAIAAILLLWSSATTSLGAQGDGNEWEILKQEVIALDLAGNKDRAEVIAKACKLAEDNPNDPWVPTKLRDLAGLIASQGGGLSPMMFWCGPLHRCALEIDERLLGPDHPYVATDLYNLAFGLHQDYYRDHRIQPLYKRSLAIREKALGPDHPDVGTILIRLAEIHRLNAEWTQAVALYERALAIREKELGSDHPDVAAILVNLGRLHFLQDKLIQAEPLYVRALAIYERANGREHVDPEFLHKLGFLRRFQGRYAEAEAFHRQALANSEMAGRNHPSVANSLGKLAALYRAIGRDEEAERLGKRARHIRRYRGPSNSRELADHMRNCPAGTSDRGRSEQLQSYALTASVAELPLTQVCIDQNLSNTSMEPDGSMTWTNAFTDGVACVEQLTDNGTWLDVYTELLTSDVSLPVVTMSADVGLFRVLNVSGDMALIPAGTFIMGSPTNELGRGSDEVQHQVTLTRDFFMQRTEVTNRQMADVLNWAIGQGKICATSNTVHNTEGDQQELLNLDDADCQISWNGAQLVVEAGKDEYPCLEVSWYGAAAYCNYLSDKEGLRRAISFGDWSDWNMDLDANGYRLPTKSEWEYACRAGTTTAFYTDGIAYIDAYPLDPNLDAAGWYYGNSTNPDNPMISGHGTHPVGLKQANAWGLFDMHGNVWEWCADWQGSYSGSVTDPMGPDWGSRRVVRGGCWDYPARSCRSADRHCRPSTHDDQFTGFRPARSSVP